MGRGDGAGRKEKGWRTLGRNPWEGTRDHGALLWEPAHYQLPPPAFMVGIIVKALFTNEETEA